MRYPGNVSSRPPPRIGESPAVRRALIIAVLIVSAFVIAAPLAVIAVQAFS